jgi:hypothetical protein
LLQAVDPPEAVERRADQSGTRLVVRYVEMPADASFAAGIKGMPDGAETIGIEITHHHRGAFA